MNLTKEEAIAIGIKAMSDINFIYDKDDEIVAIYDPGEKIYQNINIWQISFPYGKEDYGRNVDAHISILDDEKIAKKILFRNGSIDLGYNKEKDKYFIKEKRP
jgi:hypothetical protein